MVAPGLLAVLKMIVGLEVNGAGKPLSPYQALAADFDANGQVQLTDAIGVLKHVVGLTAPAPAWHFANETDGAVPQIAALSPGAAPAITLDLSGAGSTVQVGLVAYLSGDVDGEPDTLVSVRGRTALKGKDAGNAVRIAHDDGWETQYSHLRRNSVLVRPGQAVSRGTRLGQVGMSGNAEFPHVDVTVRHLGKAVDPFAPADSSAKSCARPANTLWDPALANALAYRPTGLLIAGFSPGKPDRRQAQAGAYDSRSFPKDAAAIVFWLELYGVRDKDLLRLWLEGPGGSTLAHGETPIRGNKAAWFEFVGKRRSGSLWQSGEYLGHLGLWRNGELLLERHFKASVD